MVWGSFHPQRLAQYGAQAKSERDVDSGRHGRCRQLSADEELDESDWPQFFEANPWIFGYGLLYQFGTGLDDKKLEQE